MAATGSRSARYGIHDSNLSVRRNFMRLGDKERDLLVKLIPWASTHAPIISKEFYDWQFNFAPTRDYFGKIASQKGISIAQLRGHLEGAQSGYFKSIFEGARENWGLGYFENRLGIGAIHERINLPWKWYVGSYPEFIHLTRKYMDAAYPAKSGLFGKNDNALYVADVCEVVSRVMFYDISAVGDAFIVSTLESMGLSLENVKVMGSGDKTESLDQVKEQVATLLGQGDAISGKRLDDPVLDRVMDGAIGDAFGSAIQILRVVANSAHQVNEQVQIVAMGTDEMSLSIREIAQSAQKAAAVAGEAVTAADSANTTVTKLSDSSREIGDVIKVITSIAEQTNLLALNATIEAARAGAAGKGFAVVASEVKELAKETATSSEDISQRIDNIQTDATDAVEAISLITQVIQQIDDSLRSIAAAVEEQTNTTNAMAENLTVATNSSSEIVRNVKAD